MIVRSTGGVRRGTGITLVLSALVLVLGLCPAGAQDDLASNPALATGLDQAVPTDPRITIGTLPNGLRYYIRENRLPGRRAELRLAVNAGSVLEEDEEAGLAHFVEHMAFNGSLHFPKQELIQFMESIGMRLGPGVNADTSFDETVYKLHVPTDYPEAMNKAFLFLADVAQNLTFDPETVNKERGVITEEWRQGRGADARMRDQQFPVLLAGSRYANRMPIGTLENIRTFKLETLKRFYTKWYRPDLMAVVAVGDFDKTEIETLIRNQFSQIPARFQPDPRPDYQVPDHAETLYAIASDPEATDTSVGVYSMLPARDETTVGSYRQELIDRLYTALMNSRLDELTLKPDPPYLQAGTQRGRFVRTKEAATTMALVRDGGIERGLAALITESVRAARFGFTATELDRQKRETLRMYEGAFAERNREESADLAEEYIRNFMHQEPLPGITYEYGLVRRFVPEVTLDEVNAVAKDWAGGSRVVLVNARQRAGAPVPDSARLAAVIAEAARADITPYVDLTAGLSLLPNPPQPGTIAGTITRAAYGITEWQLSNGARVVLKPTAFKQDEIVVRAISPGGTSLASDQDYVPALTASQVVGASGLGSLDPIQLRNVLSGEAASVSAFIRETDEGIAGGASPKDLETLFQLIYLTMTQPRADATVFGNLTTQLKAMLSDREASPEWVFGETLQNTLAQNNPRGGPMTPAMVDRMNLQKSLAFYKDRFADASDFTFVFSGAFDLSTMRPLVERYLASLPSLHRRETWKDLGIQPPRGVVEKTIRKGIEAKSQTAIIFSGPMVPDSEHEVALRALGIVLETRLRGRLREQLGGSYGVNVSADASRIPKPRYTVSIMFGSDPNRTDELVKALFREIAALRAKGVTESEVSDARQALLVDHESALAQNGRLAAELSELYQLSEDIAGFFDLPYQYMRLTPGALDQAVRSYLDDSNYVRVTLLPEQPARVPSKVGRLPQSGSLPAAALR